MLIKGKGISRKKELAIAIENETELTRRQKEFMKEKHLKLLEVSNPEVVRLKLSKYLNQDVELLVSPLKNKKYRVYDSMNDRYVDFGDIRYEDFTKHKDEKRRKRYLNRATNIKGDWKTNKFSANNLSINALW
jgi:hypothetical protein